MFTPEEIEQREFMAAMRGYDREEVHGFLRALAAEVRQLQARAEEVMAPPTPVDLETQVGAQVADILRSARTAAEQTAAEADRDAAERRAELDRHTTEVRAEAARILEDARATAADLVARARAEADGVLHDLLDRQQRVEASNRSALGALGEAERRIAELRGALEVAVSESRPALTAIQGDAPAHPISA